MRVYMLSGLGADMRIYRHFDLGPKHEIIALPWLPVGNSKTLGDYARLLHNHYAPEPPFALGGVSMGGMLAQEWARLARPEHLVLISTATKRTDMAGAIRLAAGLHMGPLLSKSMLTALGVMGDKFTSKTKEGRALFLDMLRKSDAALLEFGARAILDWSPPGIEAPYTRIHGTLDRVFPFGNWKGCLAVEGGNHFMIFDKGATISKMVRAGLDSARQSH